MSAADAPKDSFAKIDKTKTKRTATKYSGKDLFGMVLFILFRMQTSSGTTTRGGGGGFRGGGGGGGEGGGRVSEVRKELSNLREIWCWWGE